MNETHSQASYKSYWITWGILLTLTFVMLVTGLFAFSKTLVIVLLMIAMLVKASLIGGQFMHLRFEKPGLVLAVAGCILFFSAFLFVLISFDGHRILKMLRP